MLWLATSTVHAAHARRPNESGVEVAVLGASELGPAGSLADGHRHHDLDARAVVEAALDLLDV